MSVDLSKRFSSFNPGDRSSIMIGESQTLEEEEEEDAIEDLEAELESLMVSSLGFSRSFGRVLTYEATVSFRMTSV